MNTDLIQRIEAYLRTWHTNGNEDQNLLREALQALKEYEVRCPQCDGVVINEMDHRTGLGKWTCNIAAKDCDHSQWHGTRPNCPTCGITKFE